MRGEPLLFTLSHKNSLPYLSSTSPRTDTHSYVSNSSCTYPRPIIQLPKAQQCVQKTREEKYSRTSARHVVPGSVRMCRALLPGRDLVTYLVTCSRGHGRGKRCLWLTWRMPVRLETYSQHHGTPEPISLHSVTGPNFLESYRGK